MICCVKCKIGHSETEDYKKYYGSGGLLPENVKSIWFDFKEHESVSAVAVRRRQRFRHRALKRKICLVLGAKA